MKKIFLMSAAAAGLFGFAAMPTEASAASCDSFGECWYQNLHGVPNNEPMVTGRSAAHGRSWHHSYHHRAYEGEHHR